MVNNTTQRTYIKRLYLYYNVNEITGLTNVDFNFINHTTIQDIKKLKTPTSKVQTITPSPKQKSNDNESIQPYTFFYDSDSDPEPSKFTQNKINNTNNQNIIHTINQTNQENYVSDSSQEVTDQYELEFLNGVEQGHFEAENYMIIKNNKHMMTATTTVYIGHMTNSVRNWNHKIYCCSSCTYLEFYLYLFVLYGYIR